MKRKRKERYRLWAAVAVLYAVVLPVSGLMAKNLLNAGVELMVSDLNKEAVADVVEAEQVIL